jgi:hypothetical protein
MTHPFIEALQAAYDTHGLPPGICYVSLGSLVSGCAPRFHAYIAPARDGYSTPDFAGNGDTLQEAIDAAFAARDAGGEEAAKREAVRALVAAHGYDPNMVK